jgi:hypothetical protein
MKYLKLFESVDVITINHKQFFYYSENVYPFFWKDNPMEVHIGQESSVHGGNKSYRVTEYNEGRMFVTPKILTFYIYPDKGNWKEFIDELEKEANLKIWNNDWKIEIYGQKFTYMPIENFFDSEYCRKGNKQGKRLQHLLDIETKAKMIKPNSFGSKADKRPLKYKQALLRSESHIKLFEYFDRNIEFIDELKHIEKFITDIDGFEIQNTGFKNDILFIRIKVPRTDRPDYSFLEKLEKLDMVAELLSKNFVMSKKEYNCSYYDIYLLINHGLCENFTLQKNIDIMKFIEKYNINSMDEFIIKLTRIVRNINMYAKLTKDKTLKNELYRMKSLFVKFLYLNNWIKDVKKHKGEHGDLILFTTKVMKEDGSELISFHSIPFKLKFDINTSNLEELPDTFKAKIYNEDDVDTEIIDEVESFLPYINDSRLIKFVKNIINSKN